MIIILSPKQLETIELAVTTYIEMMAEDLRNKTYSEIMKNRLQTALEAREILREARYK